VNHVRLLDWLTSMIPARTALPRLLVLTGPPGIGKTAAACWFAHLNRSKFPGGQFYVDCAQLTGDAGTSAILADLLYALGVSDKYLPATLGRLASEYRSRTAAKPILVILENAAEAPHVRAALPNSPGSLVLVTAAGDLGELGTDGARFREVERLDEASAIDLLTEICGQDRVSAEPAAATTLVGLCAGMPIALAVLATRLQLSPGLSIADLATELSASGDAARGHGPSTLLMEGGSAVSKAYSASYGRLTPPAQPPLPAARLAAAARPGRRHRRGGG
jgi:hypothetical protein